MRLGQALAYLAASAVSLTAAQETELEECVIKSRIGTFDLRPLRRKGADYVVINDGIDVNDGKEKAPFVLNFCGPVETELPNVGNAGKVGAFQQGSRGTVSLGKYTSEPKVKNGLLSFTYTDGSTCPGSDLHRGTIVHLVCDNRQAGVGHPVFVGSLNDCSYFFSFRTPHACASSLASGFWVGVFIFLVVVFVLFLMLFFTTVVYNRFVLKKLGRHAFPSLTSMQDLLIIAGITVMDFFQGLWDRLRGVKSTARAASAWARSRGGFEGLPSEEAGARRTDRFGDDEEDERT